MTAHAELIEPASVRYPSSDGMPMADNPVHYRWIVTLKENLDQAIPHFVAADHLWYPVEGEPKIRVAPDVYVAIGRPKGDEGRPSYRQWLEEGIPPRVVFEVISPSNSAAELAKKSVFYYHYGVEEFYLIDPEDEPNSVVLLRDRHFESTSLDGFVSPLLGIRFALEGESLKVQHADGRPFLTWQELAQRAEAESQRAEAESQRAEAESQRAEAESQRAEAAEARVTELEARLRELGQL